MKKKSCAGKLRRDPAKRTARALGISRRSVFNACQRVEADDATIAAAAGVARGGPAVGKRRSGHRKIVLDDFLQAAVRREVHSFFRRKEFPTLVKLLQECRANIADFPDIGRTTLFKQLKRMGFRYRKCSSGKKLHERANIVARRQQFLRDC